MPEARTERVLPASAALAFTNVDADVGAMSADDVTNLDRPSVPEPDLAPPGTPPHVAVAPGLLHQPRVVAREDDDTDADYEARCRLLAAALRVARQG